MKSSARYYFIRRVALPIAMFILAAVACPNVNAQFSENFDGVTAPILPVGWTVSHTGTTPDWVTSTNFSNTAPNSAFINDPAVSSTALLVSPTFFYAGGQLTFRQRVSLENSFDGGVLDIKIENGGFQNILAAGGSFVSGGYNGSTGVLGQCWTGFFDPNFFTTVVNMPLAAFGKNVQLRWRRVTDSSVSGFGWNVDSIQLPASVDVAVTKTDSVDPFVGGTGFSYTITATNSGPDIATKTVARDILPNGIFLRLAESSITQGTLSVASDAVVADFGTILPGASASATLMVGTSFQVPDPQVLTVRGPASISRDYRVRRPFYAPDTTFPGISAQLKLVTDPVGNPNDGCEPLLNPQNLVGAVAIMLNSQLCPLDEAVARVQSAGALGAVVVNTEFSLSEPGTSGITITIPTVMMANTDGTAILNVLSGAPVAVTLASLPGQVFNSAEVSTAGVDSNLANNVALQYTAFLNDDDADGIANVQDLCPKVQSTNQSDVDGDGIGDLCDTCTDTDKDGAGNPEFTLNTCPLDGCTSDAGKIFPGVCGCGVADTNSDGDGAPDCTDSCPLDGAKQSPGICGCGVRDIDANSNGVIDCLVTPELRVRLSKAKSLISGLTTLPSNPKKAARQKKLRSDLKTLAADIKAFVAAAPNGVQLINSTVSALSLSNSSNAALNKLIKAKAKKFAKSKVAAAKALDSFISSLAN